MKRLLRSIIDFDGQISQEHLASNFRKLLHANVVWDRADDKRLFTYCTAFYEQHQDMPSLRSVLDYFERSSPGGDIEVIERLKEVQPAPYYVRVNFTNLLATLQEEENRRRFKSILTEGQAIATNGMEFQEGKTKIRKHGVREAVVHVNEKSLALVQNDYTARTEGLIRHDGQAVWEEYLTAKVNRDLMLGKYTGIEAIDTVCGGVKKGEMWVHCAFPGELKTSMALTWVYNLATKYKTNSVYWCLEMPYEHIRRLLFVMHAAHRRWRVQGYEPLDYRKVRDGQLTPDEERFFQLVIQDFESNPEYCHIEVVSPDHPVTVDEIKLQTELYHRDFEVGFVVVDHGGNIKASKGSSTRDHVVQLNENVRALKLMALHFNHGEKVPICLLYQINRQGHEEAIKNDGVYKVTAISYANEIEKSADSISTTFFYGDHRNQGTTIITCLKNRDNPQFAPFTASVDVRSRRIYNLERFCGAQGLGMSADEHYAVLGQV